MNQLSVQRSNLGPTGEMIDITRSNTGHTYVNIDGSVSMFICMTFFWLTWSIIYMSWRIYLKKKYMNDKKSREARQSKYRD